MVNGDDLLDFVAPQRKVSTTVATYRDAKFDTLCDSFLVARRQLILAV